MRMREFIKQHRGEIDKGIDSVTYRYDGRGGKGTIPYPPP